MEKLNKQIQNQFDIMCQTGKLFRVEISGQQVWDLYLASFKKEDDPVFRDPESSTHNCNYCKNFIRRYGNIVAIDENYNIITMFNVECEEEYQYPMNALSKTITNSKIKEVFFETFDELNSLTYESCSKTANVFRLGIDKNHKRYTKEEAEKFGVVKPNEIKTFNHFHLDLPKYFVDQTGKSVEAIMGNFRDDKNVFQKAMEEIPLDTLMLVKDLINQGSLLDGQTHLWKVEAMIQYKSYCDSLNNSQKENWYWVTSYKAPLARFRNELIGVLCVELAEGLDLNEACQNWNKRVDPANYMKATAPITKKQIEEAKKFVEENNYEESFNRRFATISDIKASEILHLNSSDNVVKSVSIFDNVKSTSTRHKRAEFDKVEIVSIDKFMKDILPGCTSVEAFLENRMEGNMVSLTTANNKESKPIFKWSNNYSWTFNGNLAGKSQIKEEVKSKGGKIDGVLRFSGIWGDNDGDHSDLDMWCLQPDGTKIGFDTRFRKDNGGMFSSCGGQLDLDDRGYNKSVKVENVYFRSLRELKDGVYKFWIHQFSSNNSKGFKAEIEFNGELYSYSYDKPVNGIIHIAEVTLKNGEFSIVHKLPATDGVSVSKEIYGLETNNFHKVNLVCLSPNHWDENNVGNKHYMFMLDKAKSPISIRSFHNENLIPELANHRKVLEVLGNSSMVESTNDQLSGLGFNSTISDELVVKLQGSHKRIVKIQF
jgi:hypothetical protein